MHAVVTNSTVDGVLAAFFGLLVVVVLLDAARIWVTVLRGASLPTTEAAYVPSEIVAPSGLRATAEKGTARELVDVGGGRRQ